ncbi:hypothetical protein [Persephonella sp.]
MNKNIKINLEVILVSETLNTDDLIVDSEISLNGNNVYVVVNKVPFYRAKIIKENSLILCKIISILDSEDAVKIKDKYLI